MHSQMKKAVHFLPPIDQLADEDLHPYHQRLPSISSH
jgi:hypothetical protein